MTTLASVRYYDFVGIIEGMAVLPELPIARRLTRLQTAALVAMARLKDAAPGLWRGFAENPGSLLYMATHYGEVDTLVSLQKALYQQSLPLSPTAFQNSLPSSALGYAAIVHRLHQAQTTFSAGFLSLDRMLQWAHLKIVRGRTDHVLCLNVAERLTRDEKWVAEAELMLFSSGTHPGFALHSVKDQACGSLPDHAVVEEEGLGRACALRLDLAGNRAFCRVARDHGGHMLVSHWEYL